MSKLESFLVIFDKPYAVYNAGEPATGHIMVQLADEMKMRGIRLNFKGRAQVNWYDDHDIQHKGERIYYKAEEIYFDHTEYLFGARDVGDMKLGPGEYRYPFHFSLPSTLPSSFEGKLGSVRYYAEATIDKPWKFDHTTRTAFTVLSILDLNLEPQTVRVPEELQLEKEMSCCCFKYGKVTASLPLSKRCYVPGETIYINAAINNSSQKRVTSSHATLKQYVEFRAKKLRVIGSGNLYSKYVANEILAIKQEVAVEPGGSYSWNNVPLVIPSLPPSRLVNCNIINVSYALVFKVFGEYSNVKLKTEIIIGTIPLQVSNYYGGGGVVVNQPSASAIELGDVNPFPAPPPPCYEECVQGKVSIKEDDDSNYVQGNQSWAPMYSVYRNYPA